MGAALAQTARFVLQKRLSASSLSNGGATFARFVYSAPFVLLIAIAYSSATSQNWPNIPNRFWAYALSGGAAQILATMCVVALFSRRNFAVGITFKKTEVLMSVVVGFAVLGEGVSGLGFLAIILGLAGVLLLSDPPDATGPLHKRIWNPSAGLGLLSGVLFAISGVGYRGASLSLDSGDIFQRAVVTLACVSLAQVVMLGAYLLWRERGEVTRVLRAWRVAGLVGLTSMIGSLCWFSAFTLQTVAYVNALGQIELFFSLMAGAWLFSETVSKREWQGLSLLTGSILMLVLVT